jgi:putative addiction module component (TIGR02574 family)
MSRPFLPVGKLALKSWLPYFPGMQTDLLETAKGWSVREKLDFLHALLEDIKESGFDPQVTQSEAEELDRRLLNYRRNPASAVPLSEVKARLEAKYGR